MDAKTSIQLVQEGKRDEAEALLQTLVMKAKMAPDKIVASADGSAPVFYRGEKRVILDEDGNWKLAQDRKEHRR
jgi:hypothetical protein